MALNSVLGASATVLIDATGATAITDWVTGIGQTDSLNANDVTTLGHTVVTEDPGLESLEVSLDMLWDGAIDVIMRAEKGVKGHHLIINPAGTATGTPKYDYTGWLAEWNHDVAVGDPQSASAVFKARALTVTTNP